MHTKITYCDEEEEACPITGLPRPRIYSSFSTEKKTQILKKYFKSTAKMTRRDGG